MTSADHGRNPESGRASDPVHDHGPDDISKVSEGGQLNPKDHHPPNAETQGVWKILRFSTLAAILALFVIGVIAFSMFG